MTSSTQRKGQEMGTAKFVSGSASASVSTNRQARFALIGNFKGEGFRVISIHDRRELADPRHVANSNFSEIQIAERQE